MATANIHNFRHESVFIVTTTTFVLASIFVAARLISRFGIIRHKTWDDWFIILAWFLAFGLSFSIDYGASKGLGKHDIDIPAADLPALHRAQYAFTILYNPALMATKTSILIFYLRMSRNTQVILRIASFVTLGIVNVAGLVLTFFNAFQCRPVTAAYSTNGQGKCISIVTLFLCSAPVNIITDLAILVLPIPVLTGMRLPQRQKTILVFTFTLGIFVTIVDVIRIYYLQKASDDQITVTSQTKLRFGADFYWNASSALMWSAVEVNAGIIAACIPTLKPLIKRILPAMITGHSGYGTKTHTSELGSDERRITGVVEPTSEGQHNPSAQVNEQAGSSDPEPEMGMMDFLTSSRLQSIPRAQLHDRGPDMDGMDFLTTPDLDPAAVEQRLSITRTYTAHTQRTANTIYFGFIDMARPKSMLKTRGTESLKYCITVTILFFLWGFSYGLLNILNNEISSIAHDSAAQTLGLSSAYFGAYFFGPLTVGQTVLRHGGFKATFITGLCIYGTGTLMFWPSAVLVSYPGFIISQFVVGFGLSVLETAANPFLALCGPSQYAETRLLLAQGVQAIGTVLSQLLAHRVLFDNLRNKSLIDVQWAYLAITLSTAMLALFFYYMPLPEATDAELQQQADDLPVSPASHLGPKSWHLRLGVITLALAIVAQFLYVAAQEAHSIYFGPLLQSIPTITLPLPLQDYSLLAATTFALGRFLFAQLTLSIPPRILLLVSIILGTVFAILLTVLSPSNPTTPALGLIFSMLEGPAFPLIFGLGLRGTGRYTKIAAAGLVAAASGGAGAPWVMFAIQRMRNGRSVSTSYAVVIALMGVGIGFPLWLSAVPNVRRVVDPVEKNDCNLDSGNESPRSGNVNRRVGNVHENENRNGTTDDGTRIRRFSRKLSGIFSLKSSKEKRSLEGAVEHREVVGDE